MPRRLFDSIDNWLGGVNTAGSPDDLPVGAFPRGQNTALTNVTGGKAFVGTRPGFEFITQLTGEPTIIGQQLYRKSDGTALHLLIGNDGSLWTRTLAGTTTQFSASAFTASDTVLPTFAIANDLWFVATGSEEKKFDGSALQKWGIAAPGSAPTLSQEATPGNNMTGTYEVFLTYYSGRAESGRGPTASITMTANNALKVDWAAPADTQITHVRVNIRRTSKGANFYRQATVALPTVTHTISWTDQDTSYSQLTTLAPAVNDNQPPPAGIKSPTWHLSRMFVFDGTGFYYTPVEEPENFNVADRYEPVNPDDGEQITGALSIYGRLLIFKEHSLWALVGDTPETWSVELVSPTFGAVGQAAIAAGVGRVFWWDEVKGPVVLEGGQPRALAAGTLAPNIERSLFNTSTLHFVLTLVDESPKNPRVMFAVPEANSSRPSLIFPYHLDANAWEAEKWDPFEIASWASGESPSGQKTIYVGGLYGNFFAFGTTAHDGVPTGAVSAGRVTAATTNTVTCVDENGASPAWTDNALKGRFVYALSSDKTLVQRRKILSNTANVLTLATNWNTVPNSTFTFVIGGIHFQIDTPWRTAEMPFHKKRHEFLFAQIESDQPDTEVQLDIFLDYDLGNPITKTVYTTTAAAVYDEALYDASTFFAPSRAKLKVRPERTSIAWRSRLRFVANNATLIVRKVAMQSVLWSTRG